MKDLPDGFFTESQVEWLQLLAQMDPKAREILVGAWFDKLESLIGPLDSELQTPIEQVMGAALVAGRPRFIYKMALEDSWLEIGPQSEISTSAGDFRVDFELNYCREDKRTGHAVGATVLVECDGHDFHEKTKAQAAKDKRRDRALIAKGYTVLHFTGSEIWRDPKKCAAEVFDQLRTGAEREAK